MMYAVIRWLFVVFWFYLTVYLVVLGGHETAGSLTFILYFSYTFLCILSIKLILRNDQKWSVLIVKLSIFLAIPSFVVISYNDQFRKTKNIGKSIQQQCNKDGQCPSEINGFQKTSGGHLRNDRLHYIQHADTFVLFFHIGPDFDFYVTGGVGKALKTELKSQ